MRQYTEQKLRRLRSSGEEGWKLFKYGLENNWRGKKLKNEEWLRRKGEERSMLDAASEEGK